MQLIALTVLILGLFLIHYFRKDISNLYNSRDNIWREHFALQQTSKRRHKELLSRIHKLERKISGLTRGQAEAQQTHQ